MDATSLFLIICCELDQYGCCARTISCSVTLGGEIRLRRCSTELQGWRLSSQQVEWRCQEVGCSNAVIRLLVGFILPSLYSLEEFNGCSAEVVQGIFCGRKKNTSSKPLLSLGGSPSGVVPQVGAPQKYTILNQIMNLLQR